jgi:hypothetical protein
MQERAGMNALMIRRVLLAMLIAASGAFAPGCVVEDEVAPPAYADGSEPMYYDGRVVYYDDGGRPFYYVDGAGVWIPPTVALYPALVAHWHAYGPAHRAWAGRYGHVYRSYRGGGSRGGGRHR